MSIIPLPAGEVLAASGDPWLGRIGSDGTPRWSRPPSSVDFGGQWDTLAVSRDGAVVRFGFDVGVEPRFRFNAGAPTLKPDADGKSRWERQVPGVAWWVAVSGDDDMKRSRSISVDDPRPCPISAAGTGRVVLIVDARHSGALDLSAVSKAEDRGLTIIASAAADQNSRERDDLKHGVLTQAALEAPSRADTNNDQVIDVDEFTDYVGRRVGELDPRQTPVIVKGFKGPLFAVAR